MSISMEFQVQVLVAYVLGGPEGLKERGSGSTTLSKFHWKSELLQ